MGSAAAGVGRPACRVRNIFLDELALRCKVDCMSELHRALGDIGRIRRQVAGATQFRGYGPATLAATGALAALAAGAQAVWVPDAAGHIGEYLGVWMTTAVVCASLTGVQMNRRSRRIHSGLSDEMIRMAVEQFLPAAGAGFLMTIALVRYAPSVEWMLPGLWQVIFSLGVFSSCRFLPQPMVAAGAWYLVTGLVTVGLGDGRAFSPWTMGVAYGVGQMLVAGILYFASPEGADEA
jgi:hypothetical protein